MDNDFYVSVLKHPPKSHSDAIFEDRNNIIWIDWGEEEDAIVGYISERIKKPELTAQVVDADNDSGYTILVACKSGERTIDPDSTFDSQHATLNAIDELLSADYQVRFVADTNGSDTIGVVVETITDWRTLYQLHGRRLNEHFCPIRELPDLMNTPGNEIDDACAGFAKRAD